MDIQVAPQGAARSAVQAKNQLTTPLTKVGCCVCGSTRADTIAEGQDFEYETTADEFRVQRCGDCGHVFLSPRPDVHDLRVIYPPEYYSYGFIDNLSPLARGIKKFLDTAKLNAWLRQCSTKTPRFLDVGCGEGWFLRLLHEQGIDKSRLWGVELDEQVIGKLAADGYQARCGVIESIHDLPEHAFDLIISLQVIEHVADPASVLRRMAELLAPGGTLILETPNIDSLDYRLFGKRYWGGFHFPRHWNLFTPESISPLLTACGLKLAAVHYLPAPTFWLYSLHHALKYGRGLRGAARWVDPFRNMPLMAATIAFDRMRAALGARTSNMQLVIRAADA